MTIALSTMWAQQSRFSHDFAAFRAAAASLGYDAIEVSHSTSQPGLEALLAASDIPVTSLHAPTPYRDLGLGRNNSDLNLASLDDNERRDAIDAHKLTIDYAANARVRYVVVHLGRVGDASRDLERDLIRRYEAGERDGETVEHLRDDLIRWRAAERGPYLEAAALSLRELVDYAAPGGVSLGVETRLRYDQIPHPEEALQLLAPYTNDEAGYWHDTGHAEVQARLRLIDRAAWFPALTSRTIGSHLHDVAGIVDHRAPGNGDVDWSYIAAGLPPNAQRVLEINQHEPDADVAAALPFLKERGVI